MGWKEDLDIEMRKTCNRILNNGIAVGERYDKDTAVSMISQITSTKPDLQGHSGVGALLFVFLANVNTIKDASELTVLHDDFVINRNVQKIKGIAENGISWQIFNFQSREPTVYMGLSDDGKKRIYRMTMTANYAYSKSPKLI